MLTVLFATAAVCMGDGSLQLRKTGSQSLTTAPHTSAKCTLGSHDLRANCLRGSESRNGGSVAEGCGLLPRKQTKPSTQECSCKIYQSIYSSPLPYSLPSCPPTLSSSSLSPFPPFTLPHPPFLPFLPPPLPTSQNTMLNIIQGVHQPSNAVRCHLPEVSYVQYRARQLISHG